MAIGVLDYLKKVNYDLTNFRVIGFDNIRLIDELSLNLDSVAYDVPLTAKNIVDYIVNGELVNDFIPHQIIKRGSI